MIPKTFLLLTLFLLFVSETAQINAQTHNLLQNPNANVGAQSWRAVGEAAIEAPDGSSSFVVRNGGYFLQDVELPKDAAGQYIVLIGRGTSERINSDGAITGLPYLYGYMMQPAGSDRKEILAYLQGQGMLGRINTVGVWVKMWGIFEVPAGTTRVRFFLMHALAAGVPHNGSAARFDSLGLFMFSNRKDARAFVEQY